MILGLSGRWYSNAALKKRAQIALQLPHRRCTHSQNRMLIISEEVREAVLTNRPVVALETTIYTHGFPYPENLQLAAHLEATVRANGGVPATCAVLDGVCRVGLDFDELERLVRDREARKISRRDIGFITGTSLYAPTKFNGGTTISGTMILAHLAGIKVFATGGLGGVHRGGESSLDISADLTELGRTPVAVISSGCKGFLDIPRTLEYLETQGVGVATFADGRTGPVDFPAFWSRESGIKSPMVVQDEAEAAAMIYTQDTLMLTSGLHFANPVPLKDEIPVSELAIIIEEALHLADEQGVTGSANTPHVLASIKRLSMGRSVLANRALIEANVVRGTKVAVELSLLKRKEPRPAFSQRGNELLLKSRVPAEPNVQHDFHGKTEAKSAVDLIVAGSIAIDTSCDLLSSTFTSRDIGPKLHTSNPCVMGQTIGGVGHNIAKAAHSIGTSVRLCSAIAEDVAGYMILDAMQASRMDSTAIQRLPATPNCKTAQYISFNDSQKNVVMAMADMSILETCANRFQDNTISNYFLESKASWLAVDANWDTPTLKRWIKLAKEASVRVAFEPVSATKAPKLLETSPIGITIFPDNQVDLATPNILELDALHRAAREGGLFERDDWWKVVDSIGISSAGARTELIGATSVSLVDAGIPQQSIQLLPFIPIILTKLGSRGVLLTQLLHSKDVRLKSTAAAPFILSRSKSMDSNVGGIYMRLYPAVEEVKEPDIVSVNGAGDTFLGALVAMLAATKGQYVEDIIDTAQSASVLTLKSREAVSPDLQGLRKVWKQD